jgi:excisionase family DNA binding protein
MPTIREFESWMTTSQAASMLNKSRQGVLWLAENGHLRGVKTQLGWLIDPKAIEHYQNHEGTRSRRLLRTERGHQA